MAQEQEIHFEPIEEEEDSSDISFEPIEPEDMQLQRPEEPVESQPTEMQIAAEERPQQPRVGVLGKIWDMASSPMIDKPESLQAAEESFTEEHPILGNIGQFGSGMLYGGTSPLDVATGGVFGASKVVRNPQVANRLVKIGQKLSYPLIAEGGINLLHPDSTMSERAIGALEALGGYAGTRVKPGQVDASSFPTERIPASGMDTSLQPPAIDLPLNDPNINQVVPDAPSVPRSRVPTAPPGTLVTLKDRIPSEEVFRALDRQGFEFIGLDEKGLFQYRVPPTGGNAATQNLLTPATTPLPDVPPQALPNTQTALPGMEPPPYKPSKLREAYELSRGLMSVDPPFMTSAAFRQAGPMVGTKNWWKAWKTAAEAFSSERTYAAIQNRIHANPLVKSGFAEGVGLQITELGQTLTRREDSLRSTLAERIPVYGRYVRASNRAYTAFLNDLRVNTFEQLVEGAIAEGKNPKQNVVLGKQIADFINDATGRGSLKFKMGTRELNLEQSVRGLSDAMFSPRGVAAKVNMLNPHNYLMTDPFVRKQYMKAMVRQVGTWWTMAGVAEMAGASVSKDPTSSDYGKIRIGDVRIDPPGGLQQFLVLGARMKPESFGTQDEIEVPFVSDIPVVGTVVNLGANLAGRRGGGTASTTRQDERFTPYGEGFKPETRKTTAEQFLENRLHPTAKSIVDAFNQSEDRPFRILDKTAQMVMPMYVQDLAEVIREDPSLGVILGVTLASGAGMGTQSYSAGDFGDPIIIPEDYDIAFGGK